MLSNVWLLGMNTLRVEALRQRGISPYVYSGFSIAEPLVVMCVSICCEEWAVSAASDFHQ